MDTERQNKISTLSELLNKTVLKDKFNRSAYHLVAKHSIIFSFWDNIAGKKLSNLSKPYKIKAKKLYIATKSATVSQQITLIKTKLLEKIKTYSKPLGVEIEDIVLNYKNYDELTLSSEIPKDEELIWINKEELDKVKINDEVKTSIKSAIDRINFLDEKQKEKLTDKILDNYRAETVRQNLKN